MKEQQYKSLIIETNTDNQEAIEFCNKFLNDSKSKKFIFGINIYISNILKSIKIDGIIDEYSADSHFADIPIIKLSQLPAKSMVLILSCGSTHTAISKVSKFTSNYLDYFSFYKCLNHKINLTQILFNENFSKSFQENINQFKTFFNLLEDETSKKIVYQLINFRLNYNLKFLKEFKNKEKQQYFEPFLNLPKKPTFVDVGAYDGYTSSDFIKYFPEYAEIYIFEPDSKNMVITKNNLSAYNNINFYNVGLSYENTRLKFDQSGHSTSKVSEEGSHEIEVRTLDSYNFKDISLIKVDVEGFEQEFIRGSFKTIEKLHPTIAISVYHQPNDFWKIPKLILSIRDDYRIYIRHYTETIYETVMFFIPKNEIS